MFFNSIKFSVSQFLFPVAAALLTLLVLATPNAAMAESEFIGAVVSSGSSAFSQQQLMDAYIDLIGAPNNPHNLDRIRNRIVALYGENGYYLPQITFAESSETANVFIFTIREPILKSFTVQSSSNRLQADADGFLNTLVGSPIYSSALIRELDTALETRLGVDVNVKSENVPNSIGDFHVDVVVAGGQDVLIAVANEGSDRLGKETFTAEWILRNSVPGLKQLYFSTFNTLTSDGFRSVGSGVTVDASTNSEFLVDGYASRALLEVPTGPDIEFERQNLSISWRYYLSQEFLRANGFTVALLVRNFQQSQTMEDIDEQLRLMDVGYWSYHQFNRHTLSWALSARQGLDAIGAENTGPLADPATDIDFNRLNAYVVNDIAIADLWALRIDTLLQISSDNLPFSQRFAIASNATARAFESGELNGDSGVGIKFELRRDLHMQSLPGQWIPYIYYGIGRVKDNLLEEKTSGAAIGLGSRWYHRAWSAYLEVGKPLIEESVYKTSTPRAQASLSYRF